MAIEKSAIVPLGEIPAKALAVMARQDLHSILAGLDLTDQRVNKLAPPLERATSNLDFLKRMVTFSRALGAYLDVSGREITVCRKFTVEAVDAAGPPPVIIPPLFPITQRVFLSREGIMYHPKTTTYTELDSDSLSALWEQDSNRSMVGKLADMSKEQLVRKVISGVR